MSEDNTTEEQQEDPRTEFEKKTETMAAKVGTDATQVTGVTQTVKDNELLSDTDVTLSTKKKPDDVTTQQEGASYMPAVDPTLMDTADMSQYNVDRPSPSKEDLGQVDAIDSAVDRTKQISLDAAQSDFDDLIDLDDISSQKLSEGAFAEAQTAELDKRATVSYQLSELFAGIEDGKPLPPWASPQARKAVALMQQRGLGASSMAAAAITQSIMESGISVASQDAQMYGAIQLKNLDNKQQAALQNALQVATMDRQNADARTKAAISNAQALLSVDLKNLDNQQQANTLKYSAATQAALTDAAAENARKQFNAKSDLQIEEFFTELGVQIDTANINRGIAIEQFNINQENAYKEFNASMQDQREKFNANMKFAIDQSNAQWRRSVNTANTATQNEVNRINAQNTYNAAQTAMNQLWQMYRDNATFNFTASESEKQRTHETMLKSLEVSATEKLYDKEQRNQIAKNLIKVIGRWGD
tara:strand:- start:619 stop:2043 length:1425 start_codon:yes stop_codon:yes gene_type:complete